MLPKSLDSVSPLADYYCSILNDDENDLEIVTEGEDWETFCANFEQKSTWQPQDALRLARGGNRDSTYDEEKKEGLETALSIPKPYHKRRRTFSVLISTEDNNRAEKCEFWGPYSHIRETLDYEYHAPYTRERQTLQDAIITDMLNSAVVKDENGDLCSTPTEPWVVFTAGAMGAGKSFTMNKLVEKGHFPLLAFVSVDPDEIRRHLPGKDLGSRIRSEDVQVYLLSPIPSRCRVSSLRRAVSGASRRVDEKGSRIHY